MNSPGIIVRFASFLLLLNGTAEVLAGFIVSLWQSSFSDFDSCLCQLLGLLFTPFFGKLALHSSNMVLGLIIILNSLVISSCSYMPPCIWWLILSTSGFFRIFNFCVVAWNSSIVISSCFVSLCWALYYVAFSSFPCQLHIVFPSYMVFCDFLVVIVRIIQFPIRIRNKMCLLI